MSARSDFWSVRKGLYRLFRDAIAIFKWAFLVVAVFVVLGILLAVSWDVYGSSKLKAAREMASTGGIPVSMDYILAHRPYLPDTSNAAHYYEAAIKVFRAEGIQPSSSLVPLVSAELSKRSSADPQLNQAIHDAKLIEEDPRTPTPDYMLAAIQDYVAKHQLVVELARRAVDMPAARYSVDWKGIQTPLPHLTGLRSISRLLALAAWVDAEENRPKEGIEKVRAGLAMGHSLMQEQCLISSLVGMAICSISVREGLGRVVARTDPGNAELETLQKDLLNYADRFTMRPAYEGELALYCDFINSLVEGREPLGTVNTVGAADPRERRERDDDLFTVFANTVPVWPLRGYLKTDEAFGIRYLASILEDIDRPSQASLTEESPMSRELYEQRYWHVTSAMFMSSLSRGVGQGERNRAMLRAAAAACAAIRFKNDRGAWAQSLGELVPGYLSSMPLDPMNGQPLVYLVEQDSILIYSVGDNLADDGGIGPGLKPFQNNLPYDDAGFRARIREPDSEPPANVNE
jgi:hypothetical protein